MVLPYISHEKMDKKFIRLSMSVLLIATLIVISFLTGCRLFGSGEKALSDNGVSAEGVVAEAEDPELLSLQEDPLWAEEDSLKAMVISDLHYTENKDQDHTLVPGIAEAERITDALIAEVIDRHPDVLIMTGDQTNSGYPEDVSGLVSKLQRVRDNGIKIVMTTGNHDFDLMDAAEYEASYFPLLEPVDRDPASLSYTAIIKDVVFLAMDDRDAQIDWQGAFSPATLQWIREMLEKYSDHTVIFLTHHNVLYSTGEEHDDTHLIMNPELPEILQKGGVKLVMTGHMHLQYITEKDGLWEILSGMPFSGDHLIGNLAVGEKRILYYAEPADLAAYDSAVKEALDRLDQESSEYMDQVFSDILDAEELRGLKRRGVMNLIDWFFYYFYAGTLADHRQEFTEDPSYERMIRTLWNYNYGPWMQEMIETTEYNARRLELSW